jgi:hypothetical protein
VPPSSKSSKDRRAPPSSLEASLVTEAGLPTRDEKRRTAFLQIRRHLLLRICRGGGDSCLPVRDKVYTASVSNSSATARYASPILHVVCPQSMSPSIHPSSPRFRFSRCRGVEGATFISMELLSAALAVEDRSSCEEQDYKLDLDLCQVSSSVCVCAFWMSATRDEMCSFSKRQKCLDYFCRGLIQRSY